MTVVQNKLPSRSKSRAFGTTKGNEVLQRETERTRREMDTRGFGIQEVKTVTISGIETETIRHGLGRVPVAVLVCPIGKTVSSWAIISKTRTEVVLQNGDTAERTFEVALI